MPDLDRLVGMARLLLPPAVAVAVADPRAMHPLMPGEALPGAVPARLAEFSAGRHAARQAMAALGLPALAVPHAADRAPVWPPGVTGSITHSATACLAAIGRGFSGIGLDLEEDSPLAPDLWGIVLLPAEQDWALTQAAPGVAAKLVFSAKEAAYKAQYPLTKTLFGFDALSVVVSSGTFTASFQRATGPFAAGHRLLGKHTTGDGHILTAVTL